MTKIGASAAAIFGGLKLGKALFVDPIKKAGDFQKSLNVLWASTEHGNKTLKDVSNLAIKLGNDIKLPGVSASDAADAMLQLGKSGFDVAQSMDAVRGTLLLATAAETDGANAAKVVTQNINAFGLQAKDTSMIVDDMAGFMNATGTSFDAFTDSLSYVAAPAKSAGQSFQETATQLAILSQNGIEGSMAGTGLRQILNGLSTDGSKASKAFKDIGISTVDAKGNFIGMRETIEKLEPVLAKMTSSERNKLMKEAFGVNSMNQAKILLGTLVDKYDKVNKQIGKQGSAARLAAAMTKGFNGAMSNLSNALENFQLTLGLKVLPKVTEFVKWLGKLAGAKSFSVAISIVWKGIVGLAGDIKEALRKAIFGNASDVAFAQGFLRVGKEAITVDPGLAAALQTSIASMVATQDWAAIGKRIGDAISKAIKISSDALDGLLDAASAWVDAHQSQIAETGLEIGLTMISKLLDPGFWAAHWQLIGGVALSAAAVLFPEARLAEIGLKGVTFLLKPFARLGIELGALATRAVIGLEDAVASRLNSSLAGRIAGGLAAAVQFVVSKAVGLMVDLGAKMITGLINKFAGLGVIMRTLLSTAIVTVIGNLIGAAVSKAGELASKVGTAIMSIPGRIASLGGKLAGAIGNAADTAATAAGRMAKRIVTGVVSGLEGIGEKALGKLTQVTNEVNQVAQDVWSAAQRIGARIVSGVVAGLGSLYGAVKGKIESTIGSVLDNIDIPGFSPPEHAGAHAIGIPLMMGVIKGVESVKDKLAASMGKTVSDGMSRGGEAIAGATEKTTTIFERWAENTKTRITAVFDAAHAKIDAEYAKAQAKLDAWKAKMTPTEALIASMQAQAAMASVEASVVHAHQALDKLDTDFQASWSKLLSDQAANLAKLKATQGTTVTDKDIAGHEFDKTNTATAGDPLAQNLLNAQKKLDAVKLLYAAGTATQAELFAAQDAFDTASAAAQDDANATKLLSDYNTWQGLVAQAAEGAAGITAQEATDAEARAAAQAQYGADRITAQEGISQAIGERQAFYLDLQAKAERTAQDDLYDVKDKALKKTYDRIVLALKNQQTHTLKKYDDMIEDAKKAGKTLGDSFADAIEDITKPGSKLDKSLIAVGKLVAKYLKLNSPADAGPLSDLDQWWTALAPTLVKSLDASMIKGALSDAVTPTSGGFGPGAAGGAETRQTLSLNDGALMQKLGDLVDELRRNNQGASPVTVIASGGAQAAVIAARR